MPFKGLFSRVIYQVAVGCGALLAYDAFAQSAAPAPADAQELGEIVVTGSFFAQPTTTNSKALEVLNSDDIAKSPQPNLGLMLSALPAMDGSIVTGNSNDENNNTAAGINLRGLGPRATLVLLNGQRQVPSAANGGQDSFIVDVDGLVPQVLVERIDVYKDGASALYGSDAVGGVVNFITRKMLAAVTVCTRDGGAVYH
jgi:iron complex outermembrane recepter protein